MVAVDIYVRGKSTKPVPDDTAASLSLHWQRAHPQLKFIARAHIQPDAAGAFYNPLCGGLMAGQGFVVAYSAIGASIMLQSCLTAQISFRAGRR